MAVRWQPWARLFMFYKAVQLVTFTSPPEVRLSGCRHCQNTALKPYSVKSPVYVRFEFVTGMITGRAIAQSIILRLLTEAGLVRFQVRTYGISGGHLGGVSASTSFHPSILITQTAPYSLIILSSTPYSVHTASELKYDSYGVLGCAVSLSGRRLLTFRRTALPWRWRYQMAGCFLPDCTVLYPRVQ
jgi:hypothetical protein